jgi:hypothetical protein
MKVDVGEVITILCVTTIAIVAILALKGGGTEIVAAGLGGLVGYLTKGNNHREVNNEVPVEKITSYPGSPGPSNR